MNKKQQVKVVQECIATPLNEGFWFSLTFGYVIHINRKTGKVTVYTEE